VSHRDLLTCDDAICLTRCRRAFVSNSCHFFRTPLSIPWRHIQSLRDADQPVRKVPSSDGAIPTDLTPDRRSRCLSSASHGTAWRPQARRRRPSDWEMGKLLLAVPCRGLGRRRGHGECRPPRMCLPGGELMVRRPPRAVARSAMPFSPVPPVSREAPPIPSSWISRNNVWPSQFIDSIGFFAVGVTCRRVGCRYALAFRSPGDLRFPCGRPRPRRGPVAR